MPSKPRRRTAQRRKPAPRARSGAGRKALLAIATLFIVFCGAAGATLWLTAGRQPAESAIQADPAAAPAEQLSADERKALDDILRGNAKKP